MVLTLTQSRQAGWTMFNFYMFLSTKWSLLDIIYQKVYEAIEFI